MTNTEHDSPVVRIPADADELRQATSSVDVAVQAVGPTGIAAIQPLVTASLAGETAFYPSPSAAEVAEITASIADGELETVAGGAIVEHDRDTAVLPIPAIDELEVGARRVLGGAGWRRPTTPADHEAAGGFVDADASDVRSRSRDVLGRGWGDWRQDEPVGDDWDRASGSEQDTAVVVNAHGNRADALLCESVPFEVLEGAMLTARATGAARIVVYLSEADAPAAERVRGAADAYPDPAEPIEVVTGPAVYRAAEPTMALEAIEGNHRLEARLRHPERSSLPTLEDAPALVHTARTYAQLAVAMRTSESPSTRLVSVSGDVAAPATVELAEESTLDHALDAVDVDGEFKAACVGGRFGGLTERVDVAPSPDALAAADLGTEGSVEVLDGNRCILSFVGKTAQFAADTNCGRCVPCREGSKQLTELLRDVYDGDLDEAGMAELVRTMTDASVCRFGVTAGRPARTAMSAFEAEVRAHADGHCPAGACGDPVEVTT